MNLTASKTTEDRKIEAYRVSQHASIGTLPRHFGCYMMIFESRVYNLMREFSPEYAGGSWAFFELSNGSFYMTPPDQTYRFTVCSNGYEGQMTADAAGITVCLFAYSLLAFEFQGTDIFTRHFHRLRDFALRHAESKQIFTAID